MLYLKKNIRLLCMLIMVLVLNILSVSIVNAEEQSDLDTDGDGLSDELELQIGTDINKADTDGDLLSDGYELFTGFTDPLNIDTDGNGIEDSKEDFDKDGLTDYEESLYNTYAIFADSDFDGLDDGEEVKLGTNPLLADTDSDGIDDMAEIELSFNPNVADTDGNGILDGDERKLQNIIYYEETKDSKIKSVQLELNSSEVVDKAKAIKNMLGKDVLSSGVVGLFGAPYKIQIPDDAENAVITFEINKNELGETDFEDILFMWYDDERHRYIELETNHNTTNWTVSSAVEHSGTYLVVDEKVWDAAWEVEIDYSGNKDNKDTEDVEDIENIYDVNDNTNFLEILIMIFYFIYYFIIL